MSALKDELAPTDTDVTMPPLLKLHRALCLLLLATAVSGCASGGRRIVLWTEYPSGRQVTLGWGG
ncbi:MAG: hypothetical protein U0992_14370 [Planctomycetaceae bacterium]